MKELTCREFDELVHEYVHRELLDVHLREAALEHTTRCGNCAKLMAEAVALADATDAFGEQMRDWQAPPRVEAEVLAAFQNHHRQAAWRRKFEWSTAGVAAAVLLIFLWTMSSRSKGPLQPSLKEDLSSHSIAPLDTKGPASLPTNDAVRFAEGPEANVANSSVHGASARVPYAASDFVPVPFTGGITSDDPGMVVRVQLTRASLAQLGYPVAVTPDDDLIRADVLVGEDGWPRGVKLVK